MTRRDRSYNDLHAQWKSERRTIKNIAVEYYDAVKRQKNNVNHPGVVKIRERYETAVIKFKDTRSAFQAHPTYAVLVKRSPEATQLFNDIEDAQMNKPLSSTLQFSSTFLEHLRRVVETPAGYELMTVAGIEGVAFRVFINREIERQLNRFGTDIELIRLSAKFQGMCSVIEKFTPTA